MGIQSVFGERPDDERTQEAPRKALLESPSGERKSAKFLSAKVDREKLLSPKPHPWQVEARERLKQRRSKG